MVVVRPPWHELSRGPIPLQEGFIPAVTAHRDVIPAVRRISDATWQASARCRASATDMFFPQRTRTWGERIRLEQAAKKICERCPVLVECRTYALEHEERHGVWGGLTESERRSRFATGRSATQKQNHRSTISDA
ncbi:WhiB family transcriptional regulator [Prescottella equi]|uniref:WhiB family transcriptional regulator n=1 Tax=Rhodococcus hoagii TaxID=43767 RepID=UPI0009BF2799|nr:WhiB family transcriptional regulator [Prescottella equi]